jgi:hypothetical protein
MSGFDALFERNLAANCQNGIPFGGGSGQTGRKIPNARTESSQNHAHTARHSAHRCSHECGILFVATEDELNFFGSYDCFENAVNFRAWNSENMANTKIFKHEDEGWGTGRLCGHGRAL